MGTWLAGHALRCVVVLLWCWQVISTLYANVRPLTLVVNVVYQAFLLFSPFIHQTGLQHGSGIFGGKFCGRLAFI